MRKYIRKLIALSLLGLIFCSAYSQTKPAEGSEDWRLLIQAKDAFDASDFSAALSYAEKAKQSRRQEIEWKVYELENTLKNSRVRRANDSLQDVMDALPSCSVTAFQIADSYVSSYGYSFFDGSFTNLIDFVESLSVYPEADCIIGKVYELDGETALAKQYLNSAYLSCDKLDIPEQKYDILYDLALISENLGDYESYETYLLLILKDDELYTNQSYLNALVRTISADTTGQMEKFFRLYRSNRGVSLKALSSLSQYYSRIGETEKSLKAASLGSVIAYTMIYETLQSRRTAWTYTNLPSMLTLAANYPDILTWGNENRVWELFCEFGDSASSSGYLIFASEVYKALAASLPDEYWRKRAENRLIK